jgi:hypothetical protein
VVEPGFAASPTRVDEPRIGCCELAPIRQIDPIRYRALVTASHTCLACVERIGPRPYLFVTEAAATELGLADAGLGHLESYPDAGAVAGRIVTLD